MLIVCGGEKGGTGKTALSTNLSVCYAARGHDTLLVDADPQRSSAKWASKRAVMVKTWAEMRKKAPAGAASMPEVPAVNWVELRGEIYSALSDLRGRYDVIIVDVGGCDSVEFRSALAASDRLYSPMVPSDCDLETAGELNEMVGSVRAMGNRRLSAHVVLNQVPTHYQSDEAEEASAVLAEYPNLALANSLIHSAKGIRKAYSLRLGVTEMVSLDDRKLKALASKAATEMWALYGEITGESAVSDAAAE